MAVSKQISSLYRAEVEAHKQTTDVLKALVSALDDWNPRNVDVKAAEAYHRARQHLGLKRGEKLGL